MAAIADGAFDIAAAIAGAVARLDGASATPRLDAELLLGRACGIGRPQVLAHPERRLTTAERARFDAAIARRAAGEPLAYITGAREFRSLSLVVSPRVLVPRPETELLVEVALECLGDRNAADVVDLGTGSGAIALALKAARSGLDVTAVDSDRTALEVAQTNAAAHGLDVCFVLSDWFGALVGRRFDLVVCNPPYVPSGDPHFEGALRHEPRRALDGGTDGLDACRAVLATAGHHLAAGGLLVLEHGYDQREAVAAIAMDRGFHVADARDDLGGCPRVLVLEPAGTGDRDR